MSANKGVYVSKQECMRERGRESERGISYRLTCGPESAAEHGESVKLWEALDCVNDDSGDEDERAEEPLEEHACVA